MNWETLLCLGDSITIGARSYLGYPEYCGNFLKNETAKDWNVVNCAVSGYTTIDLVQHIDKNWSHLNETKPELISLMIGTNDLKKNTSFSDFQIAFSLLLIKVKLLVKSRNIILNKIPSLRSGVMLPYNLSMNEMGIQYNNWISEIAKSHGLMLNEMPESDDLFFDGVHLNQKGSELWGKHLSQKILELRYES
ncbi:SGNH/GDSL hydrolase family protein [Pontibacter sp. G13]|uniref:SGNH/GDSL hydrolase family protein n=1 Tax=Pontibacter sp. G13 TaxID=3074898 RepID=UPI00288A3A96|nr:SGNH/GDSL hydrolase family protein [Pontibacter sp. G13]WNJ19040.1 SGNH/GDSL hydrolase family protein [Pontibacter sp. G13]